MRKSRTTYSITFNAACYYMKSYNFERVRLEILCNTYLIYIIFKLKIIRFAIPNPKMLYFLKYQIIYLKAIF